MRWQEIIGETVIKLGNTKPAADSPAMKMIEELNSLSKESPFNHRQRIIGQAKIEITASGNTTIRLHDIQGSGNGSGSQALKIVCDLADKYGVTIKLSAYGYADISTEDLVSWYKANGFSVMGDDDGAVDMMRDPA